MCSFSFVLRSDPKFRPGRFARIRHGSFLYIRFRMAGSERGWPLIFGGDHPVRAPKEYRRGDWPLAISRNTRRELVEFFVKVRNEQKSCAELQDRF